MAAPVIPQWLVLVIAAAAVAVVLGLTSPALAAETPGDLDDVVTTTARMESKAPVTRARYVDTTAEVAAALLGKSRDQLFEGTPSRVYLVEMRGDFSMEDMGQGSGPYLAFLYWRNGDTWSAADFTVLPHPLALRSAGVPRVVRPLSLSHPTLARVGGHALAYSLWFLPPLLLVVSAALCAWRRESGWPYLLSVCLALGVAAWQTYLVLRSVRGQSWQPAFHGAKLGILAVVVIVDFGAALVLLRARSRVVPSGQATSGAEAAAETAGIRQAPLHAGLLLLVTAAALYVASVPWLGTTGE